MARPRKHVEILEVLRLRLAGFSWPRIARLTGLGRGTVYRAYRTAMDVLQASQNPKAAKIRRTEGAGNRIRRFQETGNL